MLSWFPGRINGSIFSIISARNICVCVRWPRRSLQVATLFSLHAPRGRGNNHYFFYPYALCTGDLKRFSSSSRPGPSEASCTSVVLPSFVTESGKNRCRVNILQCLKSEKCTLMKSVLQKNKKQTCCQKKAFLKKKTKKTLLLKVARGDDSSWLSTSAHQTFFFEEFSREACAWQHIGAVVSTVNCQRVQREPYAATETTRERNQNPAVFPRPDPVGEDAASDPQNVHPPSLCDRCDRLVQGAK